MATGECKNCRNRSTRLAHHLHPIVSVPLTNVVTSDLSRARSRARRQHRARLADINDRRAGHGWRAVGERDTVKVDKGNQAAAARKVLDDPLGVVLAQLVRLGRERVRDGLAGGLVLEGDGTGFHGACIGGHGDGVAGGNRKAGEGVGIVRVPLVPGVEGDAAAAGVEVDAGLEDGGRAGVSVDADPGGGGVLLDAAAAGGNLGSGHDLLLSC